jgi:hypothetical protein
VDQRSGRHLVGEGETDLTRHSGTTLMAAVMLLIAILACGNGGPVPHETTSETGLHRTLTEEDPVRFLPPDTVPRSASDPDTLQCKTVSPGGVSMELCHFEVKDTGEQVWVLKKRTDVR